MYKIHIEQYSYSYYITSGEVRFRGMSYHSQVSWYVIPLSSFVVCHTIVKFHGMSYHCLLGSDQHKYVAQTIMLIVGSLVVQLYMVWPLEKGIPNKMSFNILSNLSAATNQNKIRLVIYTKMGQKWWTVQYEPMNINL